MKTTLRRYWPAVALFLLAIVALTATWWIVRPKLAAARFGGLLTQGKIEEAAAMLAAPSALHEDAAGNLVITDRRGQDSTFRAGELPLQRIDLIYYQSRLGPADYFTGRYYFPLASSGPEVQSESKEPRVVSTIATARGIVISSVQK